MARRGVMASLSVSMAKDGILTGCSTCHSTTTHLFSYDKYLDSLLFTLIAQEVDEERGSDRVRRAELSMQLLVRCLATPLMRTYLLCALG